MAPFEIAPYHPHVDHESISPWIDEQIWGHRLWDAQSRWLVFLEFLTVAEARFRQGALLDSAAQYPLSFKPQQRMHLRNILFNSEDVTRLAELQPDDSMAWKTWLAQMTTRARAVPQRDFTYLRSRFNTFAEFASVVQLLRGSVVERDKNRRWSSRFVFPFGGNSLYEDLNVMEKTGTANREYINFGRTGELLYLMLSRSALRSQLIAPVVGMVSGGNRWDKLVGSLQPADPGDPQTRGKSYLPYAKHKTFDDLAQDWLAISSLRLPGFDAYEHYATLASFHILLYHLSVGSEWAALGADTHMICEILSPRKTLVRELALDSYARNESVSSRAVDRYLDILKHSDEWRALSEGEGAFARCREFLGARVFWGDEYSGPNDPEQLFDELRRVSLRRHREHVGQLHRSYGRDVGLVSKRGTNRYRYAPTDSFLKTLVLANVRQRVELSEFLSSLFSRYGLVIGEREAELTVESAAFDKKAFHANSQRLEQRLSSLGLLQRLSDACAFVLNPHA
jgi:hypothetical protein